MSFTPADPWLEVFERSPVEPVILLEIERPFGTSVRFHTGDREYLLEDSVPYLDTVTPIERSIGVYDRKVSIGAFEFELVDAGGDDGAFAIDAGEVVSTLGNTVLKAARVVLRIGEAGLDEADFEIIHEGLLIEDVRKVPGGVAITTADPFSFGLDEERSTYWRPGHMLAVVRNQLLDALPPAMLTDPSLLEINYDPTAHFVVSRWPYFVVGESATSSVDSIILNNWTKWMPLRINERIAGIDQINELLFLLRGSLTDGHYRAAGAIVFQPPDMARAVEHHFTSDEVFGLEQIAGPMNVINRVEVLGHRFPTNVQADSATKKETLPLYKAAHPDSPTDLAYPTSFPEPKYYEPDEPVFSSWLNAFQKLDAIQILGFDDTATSLSIYLPFFYGFTGTALYDTDGLWDPPPNSTILPEHQIDAGKPAWLMITDHRGNMEIVKSTAFAYDPTRPLQGAPGSEIVNVGDLFWAWGNYTSLTRGQKGTTAVDWAAIAGPSFKTTLYVYDITLAVFFAESVIARHAYGVPAIRFWAPLLKYGVDIGDFISVDSPDFLFRSATLTHHELDASVVFEATRVAEHWKGEVPGISIEGHFVRDEAFVPGAVDDLPFVDDIPIGSFPPGEFYFDGDGAIYTDDLGDGYTDY